MFLRGYGSQNHVQNNGQKIGNTAIGHSSGGLGVIQGDAMRVLTGSIIPMVNYGAALFVAAGTGVLNSGSNGEQVQIATHITSLAGNFGIIFENRWTTPTANENRPVNKAVRYLIRTRD